MDSMENVLGQATAAMRPHCDNTENTVRAHSTGPVIQSGSINGGVHVYATPAPTSVVPRQLPHTNPWFVGRKTEMDALTAAVEAGHHVAAVGVGGAGKTCLVLHWAHLHAERFPDGQLFVDLRQRRIADSLPTLLQGLESDDRSLPVGLEAQIGRYRSLLAGRRMLVVLDNAADSAELGQLLPGNGHSTVLVTSRHRLDGLYSGSGVHRIPIAVLDQKDAADLIQRRIGLARVEREPAALAELTDHCGRLPLALAVVAGRLATHPSFPLAAVAAELRDASTRIEALDTGDESTTLAAVLSSSYDSLSQEARELLSLMGRTPLPDFGLLPLAALAGISPIQLRTRLRELERASLAVEHLPGRWQVHDLVRLHASQHPTEFALPMERLINHYLHTALSGDHCLDRNRERPETSSPVTGSNPVIFDDYATAMAWFEAEYACLMATQRTAVEQGKHAEVWLLTWAMHSFRWRRAHIQDQVDGWRTALAAAETIGNPRWTAVAHRLLGAASARIGELDIAFDHLQQALSMFADQGDQAGQAHAHRTLARAHERLGAYEEALAQAETALHLYRRAHQAHWEADALDLVCWYEAKLQRFDSSYTHGTEALTLYRRLDDHDGEATALDSLGYIAHRIGHHEDAIDHYQRALVLLRDRNTYHEANTFDRLAELHAELGRPSQARTAWEQALALFRSQRRDRDAERVQRQLDAIEAS